MCGICGIVDFGGAPVSREAVAAMTEALIHRGPDDEGMYFSDDSAPGASGPRAGFGFRRLSIIDVAGGHQPMRLGKKVMVFNGEIYNFQELRRECEAAGHRFQTHSDTEVLLCLYDRFGPVCLEKLNGMFAFAVWNEDTRELFLGRDRLGIKPLYYSFDRGRLVFSSEMKSLLRSGDRALDFDSASLRDFFAYRFVPAPHTVLKGVRKLRPGHFIRVASGTLTETPYWSLASAAADPLTDLLEAEESLFQLLDDSVRLQMVSDVPLGAFLSGGVDSSLITALMARASSSRIKTFSIGFCPGTGVDESGFARQVADHLGTEHHAFVLTEKDLEPAGRVFSAMNEPVADPTILPTALLSAFARREVKVVLTGEGGDELFAGYNRYKAVLFSEWVRGLPGLARPAAAACLRRSGKGPAFQAIPQVDARNWFFLNRDFDPKLFEVFFTGRNGKDSYVASPETTEPSLAFGDPLNAVLDLERRTSLADRLLMKVDMASMSQSLEARPPYLDHRVVELAFRIPARFKIRFFKGKYLLRRAARRVLPKNICWRKKHGFIVPLAQWMTAASRQTLDALLDEAWLRSLGIFDVAAVMAARREMDRNPDAVAPLWPVVVLAGWARGLK
jgi:asparagine synthase (glutamine-hydrolysing)